MALRTTIVSLLALAVAGGVWNQGVWAQNAQKAPGESEFEVVRVASVTQSGADLKPGTILFNDGRVSPDSDKGAFTPFEEWERTEPVEKRLLALYPGFTEGTRFQVRDGIRREVEDKMSIYLTEARFKLSKPAEAVDLTPFGTLAFIRSIDPAIEHEPIKPQDIAVLKDERAKSNLNPNRPWCEGPAVAACVRSSYKLEGRLPVGVALANRLRDSGRQLSDKVEFESEIRVLKGEDVDAAAIQQLTGLQTPVVGVVEQNMFYVNQILRFGKLMAVVQPDPTDAQSTIATVMIALAVSTSTLDMQKKYENVPVLRNLVPSQVLLGQSSFNTGNSISAGLPQYVRNRIKAIATLLNRA